MGYIDVSAQALTFLLSVALGALLCLMYDIVRVLHKTCVKGFAEVLVCDLLFWVTAAMLTFCFLIIRCQGMVRGFVLFGQLIGFIAVRFTVSRFFVAFLLCVSKLISLCLGTVSSVIGKCTALIEKKTKKFLTKLKKVLQHKRKLLYNLLKTRIKREKRRSGQTNVKEM